MWMHIMRNVIGTKGIKKHEISNKNVWALDKAIL